MLSPFPIQTRVSLAHCRLLAMPVLYTFILTLQDKNKKGFRLTYCLPFGIILRSPEARRLLPAPLPPSLVGLSPLALARLGPRGVAHRAHLMVRAVPVPLVALLCLAHSVLLVAPIIPENPYPSSTK